MKKNIFVLLLICLPGLSVSNSFAASAGDLDPTFGTGGKVYAVPANFMPAEDVAIQTDGKIVIAGSTLGADSTQDFGVVRLNANGTPDTSFGTLGTGLVQIPFDAGANEMATAIVVQSDGKIVVAGSVQLGAPGWDFGVVRLNTNGTVDATYSGGKVKINFSGEDFVNDMLIQPDDKVVIVGSSRVNPNKDFAIARLTTAGGPDTTFFSSGGRLFIDLGPGNEDEAFAIARQADGSLIMAGRTAGQMGGGDFALVRLTALGQIDTSFGSGGAAVTPIGTQNDAAYSVAVQSDGKIIAAGLANSGSFDEAAFARYTTAGQPDPTFDGDGKVSYDIRTLNSDILRSVLVQSDGKIIGVGASGGSFILVRLLTNGSLDTGFGTGGKVATNVAPSNSAAHRAVLQPDGKILAVGDGSGGPGVGFGFTAARFLTNGTQRAPFDFDGDGKTDIGITRPLPAMEWWINRSGSGQTTALQFGSSSDKVAPADYTGDGKTDITFWRPSTGEWYVLRSEDNSFFAFPFGTSGDIPAPADFDGDGKGDFAVFRPSSATWYIRRSSDGQVTFTGFGANGDVPVASDYDGDGKADVAIFRNNNGVAEWWINRSTAGLLALQFGAGTDKPVQGDYTGDGKTDIAFFRPASGEWYILRSEDFSYFAFPFGSVGDTPAPGDYDGDGKIDPAVFRASGATWYLALSSGSGIITQFGANGDRPIPGAFIP